MMTWLARWRRPVGVGLALALVGVVGGVAATSGLKQAEQLVAILGVIPLAAAALAWALRLNGAPTRAQLDEAASALARQVRYQWQTEAAVRGLLDPRPLGVRWAARYDIADHRKNAGSIQTGRSDEIASFATHLLELPRRRLVITGDPGSGKTSLVVLLLLALLENPARGELVPVLASVASWDPSRERLAAWLTRRMELDYPGLQDPAYGAQAARELLRAGRVLPILDGLDELPEPARAQALEAINRELPAASPLILTCRTAEYLAAVSSADVLTGAALVQAEPVRPAQAVTWLRSGISPHRLHDWKPVFRQLRQRPAGPLAQALHTPLTVWLVRAIYRQPGHDPAELTDATRLATPGAIRDHLLDALIPALVNTGAAAPPRQWTVTDAVRWLSFIADLLDREATSDLAWWRLHRALPSIAPRLICGGAVGLAYGVLAGILFHLPAGLAVGVAGLVVAAVRSSNDGALPCYASFRGRGRGRLPRRRFAEQLIGGLVAGSLIGLAAWESPSVVTGPLGNVVTGSQLHLLAAGLIVGLVAGLVIGTVEWLRTPARVDLPITPGRVLTMDRLLTLVSGTVITAAGGTVAGLIYGPVRGVVFGLAAGLSCATVSDLGAALIGRRLALRATPLFAITALTLATRTKTPLRLIRFLDDAHQLGILRQVGAVYQFRHAQLQDHLAATYRRRGGQT